MSPQATLFSRSWPQFHQARALNLHATFASSVPTDQLRGFQALRFPGNSLLSELGDCVSWGVQSVWMVYAD